MLKEIIQKYFAEKEMLLICLCRVNNGNNITAITVKHTLY